MQNPQIETFIENCITEYENYKSNTIYSISNDIKILASDAIFNELMENRNYNRYLNATSLFIKGVEIVLDKSLPNNAVYTYKTEYYQGPLKLNHRCDLNLKRYNGYTDVDDFCTICGAKFKVDLFKR